MLVDVDVVGASLMWIVYAGGFERATSGLVRQRARRLAAVVRQQMF